MELSLLVQGRAETLEALDALNWYVVIWIVFEHSAPVAK